MQAFNQVGVLAFLYTHFLKKIVYFLFFFKHFGL